MSIEETTELELVVLCDKVTDSIKRRVRVPKWATAYEQKGVTWDRTNLRGIAPYPVFVRRV